MDEYIDQYGEDDTTVDPSYEDGTIGSGDGSNEPVEDGNGDPAADPTIEDVIRDVLEDYFGVAEEDPEDDEENDQETDGDPEEDIETDDVETGEAAQVGDGIPFDAGILTEINDNLQQHANEVSGFMNKVTVSGNAVTVTLDAGSSALLEETIFGQALMSEQIDHMTGLIVLVLFVLLFDLIHRFARRTIKNFMRRGEKNATNS